MSGNGKAQPIIVIKRKGGHGGHHGGAWKVAYADFVTAMMSLFIVLWLMGSSEKVKKAVAGYFNDPKGTGHQKRAFPRVRFRWKAKRLSSPRMKSVPSPIIASSTRRS